METVIHLTVGLLRTRGGDPRFALSYTMTDKSAPHTRR